MARYKAVYKCPLCGSLITNGMAQDVRHEDLPELVNRVIQNQQIAGNPYLYEAPMYIPCKCSNGDVGLAVFAGFVHVDY